MPVSKSHNRKALKMKADLFKDAFTSYYAAYEGISDADSTLAWQEAFDEVARLVVSQIQPKTVMDMGCGFGCLVERLRNYQVDAYGIDPDPRAIQHLSERVKSFCRLGDLESPLQAQYDLIICLETLKRMDWNHAQAAVENLCRHTNDILFSVTPYDYTGIRVRSPNPPEDWAAVFARHGFFRDQEFDASSILPWAIRLRRSPANTLAAPTVVHSYEQVHWKNKKEIQDLQSTLSELQARLGRKELEISQLNVKTIELEALRKEVAVLTRQVQEQSAQILEWHNHWTSIQSSRTWRLFMALQRLQPRLAPKDSPQDRFLDWSFTTLRKLVRWLRHEPLEPVPGDSSDAQASTTSLLGTSTAAQVLTPITSHGEQLKIALYSADPWSAACVHLRLTGPAAHPGAGIQLIAGTHWEQELRIEFHDEADLVLIQRDFPRYQAEYQQVIEWANAANKPVLFEIDDLLTELPDVHPEKEYFQDIRLQMLDAMQNASGVIVSTPALADYARRLNPNTWVLPNYLDDRIWRTRENRLTRNRSTVVIGYMGGVTRTHLPDLELVTSLLQRLMLRYGERLTLRFWGVAPPEIEGLPNVEFPSEKFPDYAEFARYFSNQSCDIFIAPLRDSLFNRCKSSIKYLEYSSLGIPGVYSRIAPYSQIVISGKNGFLASDELEWEASITHLIEDHKFRQQVGQAAYRTVTKNWLLSQHSYEWGMIYRSALASRANTKIS